MIESLQAAFRRMGMIKAFRAEQQELRSFEGIVRQQYALGIQDRVLKSVFSLNSVLGFDLWNIFVIWFLGRGVIGGRLTVGDLLALLLLFGQIRQPLFSLSQQFGRFRTGMASLRRIHEVFGWPAESEEANSVGFGNQKEIHIGQIDVRNLYFGYSDNKPIFRNLNLEFAPNSYITLAGDNGSGKSTLIQLLLGNEKPSEGSILVDGQPLQNYSRTTLRTSIVCVDRDQGILSGTIRDNIAYGNTNASDNEIIQAIKDAALWEWFEKFPNGLDTFLRHEVELSRGERQRIAIARALLVDPRILILDEVTSDFDLITDYLIQKSIRNMLERRTVITVGQHASALKNADRILFMKNGNIQDDGTFTSLMTNRGEFFGYYSMVHGGFPEFKKMLDYEIDRCFRHKSGFSVAAFVLDNYSDKVKGLPLSVQSQIHSEIFLAWSQSIRRSDAVTEYQEGVYLVLLPEFKEDQSDSYLERIENLMSAKIYSSNGQDWKFEFRGSISTFEGDSHHPRNSVEVIDGVIRDWFEKFEIRHAA
ncbi:MAG: ABC transporter ATP-binding protein [Bdellovibrionia bacterium]